MSKNQPGQVVLDAIDKAIVDAEPCTVPFRTNTHEQTVLRAYRAAFKKMAGMSKSELDYLALLFLGVSQSWTTPLLVKDILKARAVEAGPGRQSPRVGK